MTQPTTAPPSVAAVTSDILRQPTKHLLRRWNWKSAVMSVIIRAAIFFTTSLKFGWKAGVVAVTHDLWFRFPLSGITGALSAAYRHAQPAWLATVCVMLVIPALAHAVEFVAHWSQGTAGLRSGIKASIAFTVISILFNYFAMRRGLFVVDGERHSLWYDLKMVPKTIFDFVLLVPRWIVNRMKSA
jgi:hypothetical protein